MPWTGPLQGPRQTLTAAANTSAAAAAAGSTSLPAAPAAAALVIEVAPLPAISAPATPAPAAAAVVEVAHPAQAAKGLNVHLALLMHVAAVLAAAAAVHDCHLVQCLAGHHVKEVVLVVGCRVCLDCLLRLTQSSLLVEVLVRL